MSSAATDTQLRAVVRELLGELLAEASVSQAPAETVGVSITSDQELDAFVRRIVTLAANPSERSRLLAGRLRFTLNAGAAAGGGGTPAKGSSIGAGVTRIERGAVIERHVAQAAAQGGRLVVGHRAVLTPLARERARKLGVQIEKEKAC